MTKFLIKASYTPEGQKGILKNGATTRKEAVEKMITDLGGKSEAFYYAFGETDVFAIAEVPDTTILAAISLHLNATGLVNVSVTILLTPAEIDKATTILVNYRAPGS